MKNRLTILFILAIVAMFLAGCSGQPAVPEKEEVPVKETVTPAKEVEQSPAEETESTVDEPVQKVPDKKMQELLKKHVGRITSLSYMYQDATNKPEEWETLVKDGKMVVKLREMDNVQGEVYIDNVYMDLDKKSAEGYCERAVYRCKDPNTAVDVKFAKYYRKTPIEWIEGVTYAVKDSEEQMQQRTVWKIISEEDGKKTTMWVDDYYGVPLKVRVVENGVTSDFIYEDLSYNSVEDSSLAHSFVTKGYTK